MDPTMRPPGGPGFSEPPPLPAYPSSPGTASFNLGDLLGQAFSIYKANFLAFVIIMALVSIPAIVAVVLLGTNPLAAFIPILIGYLIGPIATGAITYGVYEYLSGRSTTVGDCLGVGFANLVPVIGVALLSGLIIVVGMMLCVVPGIIASVVLALAVPVAIQEKPYVTDALRRSASLTEGYRWTVFGVLFVMGSISFILSIPVGVIFGISGHPEYARLAGQLIAIVVGGLAATAPAVMYYRLRSIKESLDVRDIASVFA
jgi:hypothetical protein